MKVVALVSGGKDSCYNMMQCVAAGHEIVALGNLAPYNQGREYINYVTRFFLNLLLASDFWLPSTSITRHGKK